MAVTRKTLVRKKKNLRYKKPTFGGRYYSKVASTALIPSYGPGMYALRKASKTYRSRKYVRLNRRSATLSPFPRTKFVLHKYADRISLPAGSFGGAPVIYTWRANSVFDPDKTGTGHQPMFHDEMKAKYNFYTVLSSTIKITIIPENTVPMSIGLWTDDDETFPSTLNDLQEQRGTVSAVKLDKRNNSLVLNKFYNAARWNKTTTKAIMSDNDQKVAIDNNPSATAVKYYNLQVWPHKSTETLQANTIQVDMTFYVAWREPKEFTGS